MWRQKGIGLTRDSGGPWDGMNYHGQNGFLNVLISLKWWRDCMPAASEKWEEGVEDVIWVLGEMERYVFFTF